MHGASQKLGHKLCSALPAFHALTGCNTTSSLAGVGKKKARKSLCRSEQHQESLELLTPCFLTKDTAPASLLELTTCGYKKLVCQSNCSNPHAVLFDIGDESDDDSETKSD